MKKQMCLLGLGACSFGLCGSHQRFAYAGDPPEVTRKAQVVVVNHGDKDLKVVVSEIEKELDKANVSNEIKAQILKQVEAAVEKASAAKKAGRVTLNTTAQANKSGDEGNEEVSVTIINKDDENQNAKEKRVRLNNMFKTQIVRAANQDGESFRIGIACSDDESTEDSDGSSTTKGGLRIVSTVEGSPAEKAGVKKGDILVTVNAKPIDKVSELMEMVQEAGKKGEELTVELKRDDKNVQLSIKPTKMKTADVEMNNIALTLPSGGFVLESDGAHEALQGMLHTLPGNLAKGAMAFNIAGSSDELKKEIAELKGEIAELKKMIQSMIDKK